MVNKINEKEFEKVERDSFAVIDFSAVWCGPCKMLAPVLEGISEEMNDVKFYNVDVDECPELARKFNINSIPALVILKDGKQAAMQVGFQPKGNIEYFINNNRQG